jgi:hypothetical protein
MNQSQGLIDSLCSYFYLLIVLWSYFLSKSLQSPKARSTFSAVAGAVSCTTPPSARALATASFIASNTLMASIRIVLTELSERLAQALKDKAELNNALARLLPKDA